MTVCPIAIVSGCRKCPVFSVCPLKGVIGNYDPFEHDRTRPSIRIADLEKKIEQEERDRR